MKINLSNSNPAEIETECLVAVVLDRGEKEKTEAYVAAADKTVQAVATDAIASGETAGKSLESTLFHAPAKLKAKRLLLLGGGKAKKSSATDLRKIAGAAVRSLKSKGVRNFAILLPDSSLSAADAAKAVVEGAFIGLFDSDTYKSDRKNQSIDSVTLVAQGDQAALQKAADEARIIGESLNFTRQLVNEPSNRMTPTVLADHAKKMSQEVGLKCEVYGADKIKELKMGAFWGVAQGSDEPPALIVMRYEPAGAPEKPMLGLVGKGITFDTG